MESVGVTVDALPPTPSGTGDAVVWMPEQNGILSAKHLNYSRKVPFAGAKLIWKNVVHPRLAAKSWKLMHSQCCASQDKLKIML